MLDITIWSDGSSKGNPGPGGYGTIISIKTDEDTAKQVEELLDMKNLNHRRFIHSKSESAKILKFSQYDDIFNDIFSSCFSSISDIINPPEMTDDETVKYKKKIEKASLNNTTPDKEVDIRVYDFCGFENTTNNRMELMGVIRGFTILNMLDITAVNVTVITDSQYVVKAFNERWVYNWEKNGWRNTSGDVKNVDLWRHLLNLISAYTAKFKWIKGHGSCPENNQCDMLAVNAASGKILRKDEGYKP